MSSHKFWLALASSTVLLTACGGGSDGGSSDNGGDNTGGSTTDFVSCVGDTCTLAGVIDQDYTLDASKSWILDGLVAVGEGNVEITSEAQANAIKANGVDLTIPAGTDIKALNDGILLVTRGSRLFANGTAANPITFSSLDNGFDGLGEWGGIVLQGFAPQYGAGGTGACFAAGQSYCNVAGEGGPAVAFYGGNDPADDSGVIRYVRIAEGGLVAGPNNEVNGLTLQGVGHATEIDYVHVHGNLDDGVEWFGGTVNAKHLVLTNNDDDSIDFDEGYQGNIQYAIVRMDSTASAPQGSNDPRGIEANSSDDEYVLETQAALANVTLLGATINDGEPGMRLRGALTVAVYNTAVDGFDRSCVRIDHADIDGDGTVDELSKVTLVNVLGDCNQGFYHNDNRPDTATNAMGATLTFDTAWAVMEGVASVSTTDPVEVDNGSNFTFDNTDYVGAVAPGTTAANAWWAGWTIPGAL